MSGEGSKLPQIVAATAATMGAFSLGQGLGWTSPVLPFLDESCPYNPDIDRQDCQFGFTKATASWISAVYPLAASFSGIATGFVMTKIGRRYTMIFMTIPSIIGWTLLTMAGPLEWDSAWAFYVGRFLSGFGGGSSSLSSTIYINEISETSIRGALGNMMQFMLTVGVLWDNALGAALDWTVLTGIMLVFPVILGVAMFFMPESPYYLIVSGREPAARKSLRWLRGKDYDLEPELQTLKDNVEEEKRIGSISIKELLTVDIYWKPFLIMMLLMFFQQYSGINAILFYLQDIFSKAGTDISPGLQASLVSLVQVLSTGLSIFIVDKMGRKILLIVSDAIMAVSILALGVYFFLDENIYEDCGSLTPNTTMNPFLSTTTMEPFNLTTIDPPLVTDACVINLDGTDPDTLESLGWLPLTSLLIYIFAFSIGFGPVPWMINSEFFSMESRGLASAICTAFNWLCAFLVSKFEVNIEEAIGTSGAYFMYASICAVGTLFVIFIVPETKGRTPDDMKRYFKHGKFVDKEEIFGSTPSLRVDKEDSNEKINMS